MSLVVKHVPSIYSAIVALTPENGMGMNGKIPWRVPEDFQYFKGFTMGKTCVMGRKTYEDILTYAKDKDNPLPGRKLIVLSRSYAETDGPSWGPNHSSPKTVRKISSMRQLIGTAGPICFIGGVEIYKAASKFDNVTLSVTRLHFPEVVSCDVFFKPEDFGFKKVSRFNLGDTDHAIEMYMN